MHTHKKAPDRQGNGASSITAFLTQSQFKPHAAMVTGEIMTFNYTTNNPQLLSSPQCLALFLNHNSTESSRLLAIEEIMEMALKPQYKDKKDAYALAPQTSGIKTKSKVANWNKMTCLWIDIDSGNRTLEDIKQQLDWLSLGCYLIYATHSSTSTDKRWRVLIPLQKPLPCSQWVDIQEALQILLHGDTSATRIQQILYAPNRGQHYEYYYQDGMAFDTIPGQIQATIDELKAKRKLIHQGITARLQAMPAIGNGFGIADANNSLDTQVLLKLYGYQRKGRKWLSPNSKSGTPGLIAFNDGRWFSHHSGDAGIGLSVDGGQCGDAFDLYAYYEHDGDSRKSLAMLCRDLDSEGQKRRQFEFMKNKKVVA